MTGLGGGSVRELGGEREAVFGCVTHSIGSRRAALIRAVRGGGFVPLALVVLSSQVSDLEAFL